VGRGDPEFLGSESVSVSLYYCEPCKLSGDGPYALPSARMAPDQGRYC
jgi:hypothetical protein